MMALRNSVLGTLYRCWLDSRLFAALRWLYRFLRRAAAGSAILSALFGPDRLEGVYDRSVTAGLLRRLTAVLAALGRGLVRWLRGSAVCAFLAPALRSSVILRSENLFGGFLCVMFIVPHDHWNNLWAVVAAVFFLLLFLLRDAGRAREPVSPAALGPGFALFALSCALSLGFTTDLGDSLRILLFFLSAFAFCYLIAFRFDDPKALRRLMGFLYVSLLAVSCYGIAQRLLNLVYVSSSFTDLRINKGVPGRVYASLDNPNNLSGFIQLFLPLAAAYAGGAKRGRTRGLLALGLVLPLVALVMTYARAGWLSVALAAAVFVYCRNKRLLPALAVLAVLAVPLLPASVLTRLNTITDSRDSSANHRLAIWRGVLALLRDRGYWLTGIGLGPATFLNVYPNYAYGVAKVGAYQSQMLYLELDLEMGLLGFVSFLWMMLKTAGRAGRDLAKPGSRENGLILTAFLSTAAALALSSTVEYLWFYQRLIFAFFIFLGVGLASMRIAER